MPLGATVVGEPRLIPNPGCWSQIERPNATRESICKQINSWFDSELCEFLDFLLCTSFNNSSYCILQKRVVFDSYECKLLRLTLKLALCYQQRFRLRLQSVSHHWLSSPHSLEKTRSRHSTLHRPHRTSLALHDCFLILSKPFAIQAYSILDTKLIKCVTTYCICVVFG